MYHFLKTYPTKIYQKGEIIVQQDETPVVAYIIKSGIVKTYDLTVLGEEKLIEFNLEGETLPMDWIFSRQESAQYFHEALTDCEVFVVSVDTYDKLLKSNIEFLYERFHEFIGRYRDHQMHIYALEQSKASEKVLYTMYYLSRRFGRNIDIDHVKIQLPLTQQDIANFMGLARETTVIELKKLERQGVISHQNRMYIIRTDKLEQMLGEEYKHDHKEELRRELLAVPWLAQV